MNQWSEERIAAYKRYIENDTHKIREWKHYLAEQIEGVSRAESMLASLEQSRAKTIAELADHGVVIKEVTS
jgi:hypothetical protein